MPRYKAFCRAAAATMLLAASASGHAQTAGGQALFGLEKRTDSLYVLTLKTDNTDEEHLLRFPVYRFCTGDVDGDGSTDAMVGVIKRTRFDPKVGRRLFIFKNYHGLIRALWMGTRLGGILQDFRFIDGIVRSLETTTDGKHVVAEYKWDHFGMAFQRFLATNVTLDEAQDIFNQ